MQVNTSIDIKQLVHRRAPFALAMFELYKTSIKLLFNPAVGNL